MDKHIFNDNPWWDRIIITNNSYERLDTIKVLTNAINSRGIVCLAGTRGVGKTNLLKQVAYFLIKEKKFDPKSILYIDLENICYANKSIDELVKKYRTINRLGMGDKVILLLDEVGMENRLKEVVGLKKDKYLKIFCATSTNINDKQLEAMKRFQIMPLSFYEYLDLREISLGKDNLHLVDSYFEEYLAEGGLPGIITKEAGLSEIVDRCIVKDIVVKNGLKDAGLLNRFFLMIIENATLDFSINDFSKALDISPDTARRFLGYFEDAFLIDLVEKWSASRSTFRSAKKIYLRDLSFFGLAEHEVSIDKVFDNYIYLQLKGVNPKFAKNDDLDLGLVIKNKILIKPDYGSQLDKHLHKIIMRTPFEDKVIVNSYKAFQEIL